MKSASSGKEREAVAAVAQPGAGDVDGEAFLHFLDGEEEEEEGDRVAQERKGKRRKAAIFGDSDEEQEQQQSLL